MLFNCLAYEFFSLKSAIRKISYPKAKSWLIDTIQTLFLKIVVHHKSNKMVDLLLTFQSLCLQGYLSKTHPCERVQIENSRAEYYFIQWGRWIN